VKVKVIHPSPGYHPIFGELKLGQIIDVPDKFNISGDLFKRVEQVEEIKSTKRGGKRYDYWA